MSALTDQFAADLVGIEALESGFVQTMTTGSGESVVGRFTPFTKADKNEIGGFIQTFNASFFARLSLFTTVPIVGEIVTIDSIKFRVASKVIPPDKVDIEFQIESTH